MEKETSNRIRLGLFVISGLILLIIGLYLIGSNRNLFGKNIIVHSVFYNISGLQIGNNVRFGGIDVGTVDKMEIINDTSVRVTMSVQENLLNFIRTNSYTSIGTDGLMGNKLVNIDPGTPNAPTITDGATLPSIKGIDTEQMLRTLNQTNDNVSIISEDLRILTGNINKSRGTLYTVLMDTTLAFSLKKTLTNIEDISQNLESFTGELSSVVKGVQEGHGTLGGLINDSSNLSLSFHRSLTEIEQSSINLNKITSELNTAVAKINSGEGPAGTLLNDPVAAEHLKKTLANLDSSSANFNENMKALQSNFLFKKYFRKKAKENK
ncbi:MAG: MCE family protein [Bacteroidetes bacterium]|nr:MCE family protein [Bacteroidota bacterium]MBL0066411.1 MCE family protein [Bacteroidota bacterium]MBL0138936.1 MCE family protein [Bacteroidota bacterium]